MKNRAILFVIFLFFALFSANCVVFSADLAEIQSKQKELSYLRHSDFADLVLFSGYDVYYDRKLQYNPKVRKVIKDFETAEKHAEQSNVSVAYHEFRDALNNMDQNDFYYMTAAYRLSQFGFFSLAHLAMSKVQNREIWGVHINAVRKLYFPDIYLKAQEEVFLAGLYSDIVYNNLTDESLEKLEKSGNAIVKSDYANYLRARAYYEQKNFKEALSEINRAISANSDNLNYKKFKVEILTADGKTKEAAVLLKQLLSEDIPFVMLVKELDKIKYYALSESAKDELLQKFYLAYYFYLNRDYPRAISELNMLLLKGDYKNAPKLLGKIYILTGDFKSAKKLYDKVLVGDKKAYYAHKGLGDILLAEDRYQDALAEYKLAEKGMGRDVDTLIALCVTSFKTKDYKQAYKYLSKAQKVDGDNYKVLYLSSQIQKDFGKQNLLKSLEKNVFYPEGWLDMSRDALDLNDTKSAEEYINTAAYITKKSPRYFYYKSLLNTANKNYDTALSDINRAKQIITEKKAGHEQI